MFLTKSGTGPRRRCQHHRAECCHLRHDCRVRLASDAPSQAVEELAGKAGTEIPGGGSERGNRLAGLRPLSGMVTGVAVGVAGAFAWRALTGSPDRWQRPHWPHWPWQGRTVRWLCSA